MCFNDGRYCTNTHTPHHDEKVFKKSNCLSISSDTLRQAITLSQAIDRTEAYHIHLKDIRKAHGPVFGYPWADTSELEIHQDYLPPAGLRVFALHFEGSMNYLLIQMPFHYVRVKLLDHYFLKQNVKGENIYILVGRVNYAKSICVYVHEDTVEPKMPTFLQELGLKHPLEATHNDTQLESYRTGSVLHSHSGPWYGDQLDIYAVMEGTRLVRMKDLANPYAVDHEMNFSFLCDKVSDVLRLGLRCQYTPLTPINAYAYLYLDDRYLSLEYNMSRKIIKLYWKCRSKEVSGYTILTLTGVCDYQDYEVQIACMSSNGIDKVIQFLKLDKYS